jgi:hypothetical protein
MRVSRGSNSFNALTDVLLLNYAEGDPFTHLVLRK